MNENVIPMRIEGGEIQVKASVGQTVIKVVAPDEYTGSTEVTPSDAEQVLATKGKLVRDDITVHPAPTEYLSTDHNGTFTPSDGKVGFYQVDVDVNPDLRPLSVSENGTYQPDGFDGYDSVMVDVPQIITPETMCQKTQPSGDIVIGGDVVNISEYTFYGYSGITSVLSHNTGIVNSAAFQECASLETVHFTSASQINANAFRRNPALLHGVFETAKLQNGAQYCFGYCAKLKKLDFGENTTLLPGAAFEGSSLFDTLILRTNVPCRLYRLGNAWHPFSSTTFKQGGSGGTLYIPKTLYDHLGDGTELDYLADSSWNQILSSSWGNNQVLPIEGSPYEHYYADGTPIS